VRWIPARTARDHDAALELIGTNPLRAAEKLDEPDVVAIQSADRWVAVASA